MYSEAQNPAAVASHDRILSRADGVVTIEVAHTHVAKVKKIQKIIANEEHPIAVL